MLFAAWRCSSGLNYVRTIRFNYFFDATIVAGLATVAVYARTLRQHHNMHITRQHHVRSLTFFKLAAKSGTDAERGSAVCDVALVR
jgi:hypothetical protein